MRSLMITLLITLSLWGTDSLQITHPELVAGTEAPGCYAKSIDGDDFFLSRYVGPRARRGMQKPIVLSFFTSSCLPCRKEIPFLHNLGIEYPDIGVYLVNVGEHPETVRKYVNKMNYTLPVLLDRYGKISENYLAKVTPTLVTINENGLIEHYKRGFTDSDTSVIREYFQHLANQ